ncbi:hypothetical protein JHV675_54010 [Mycobacterium avium subsp. hominissuis]
MFTVAVGAGGVGIAVRAVGDQHRDDDFGRVVEDLAADWEPLGAIAIGYAAEPAGPRDPVDPGDLLIRK